MGNFYTNVTVRHADPACVAALLEDMGSVAYVSPAEKGSGVVFDAAREDQDIAKLKALAGDLSRRHGGVALAVLNHDDDVLYYWMYDSGRELDHYDSWPGFPTGQRGAPNGGDVTALCSACEALDQVAQVEALLRGPSPEFEVERHEALVELLGLPRAAVGLGYEYIAQGDLPEGVTAGDLRAVGIGRAPESGPPVADPGIEEIKRRLSLKVRPSPELAAIIGAGPVPHLEVMSRVFDYIRQHEMLDVSNPLAVTVVMDDALRRAFGVERMLYAELPHALERHLTPL